MSRPMQPDKEDQSSEGNEVLMPAEQNNQPTKIAGNKYYIHITNKRLKGPEDIIKNLQQTPGLVEVKSVNDCDFIVDFCPIVSRAGTDIEAALKELNALSESKPAVFMVLHHTFDPEKIVPDSSKFVNRLNTLTVDFLFHEDQGFLGCMKNNEGLNRIQESLPQQASWFSAMVYWLSHVSTSICWLLFFWMYLKKEEMTTEELPFSDTGKKYYIHIAGKMFKGQKDFIRNLQQTPGLVEVKSVNDCDFIVDFCPIVSRAGTDIEAALKELNALSVSKPAIFMMLHHTFDPEKTVPDSSKFVNRSNTLTVDCLFHEDEGFLQCVKNNEALNRIQQWLPPQIKEAQKKMRAKLPSSHTNQESTVGMSESEKCAAENMKIEEDAELDLILYSCPKDNSSESCWRADWGTLVVSVDTTHWFSSGLPLVKMMQNMQTYIYMCSSGPYILLLVIPVKRFTEEKREIVRNMERIVEEKSCERAVIIFTFNEEQENQSKEMFIQDENIRNLVKKCGNRFNFLNYDQIRNRAYVSELLREMFAENMEISGTCEEDRKLSRSEIDRPKHTVGIPMCPNSDKSEDSDSEMSFVFVEDDNTEDFKKDQSDD